MPVEMSFPCVRVRQNSTAKDLLLFSASAIDIERFVGVPQRLGIEETETAGFQRSVPTKREKALRLFFSDPNNVIQNPLLCAIRQPAGVQVSFKASDANVDPNLGTVEIRFEDFSQVPLVQLFRRARAYLEERVPSLKDRKVPTELEAILRKRLGPQLAATTPKGASPASDDELYEDEEEDGSSTDQAEDALFDESQITEFWDQIRAREALASDLAHSGVEDGLLGFSRSMLEAYLQPIILVDGQHRLRGAKLAAMDAIDKSSKVKDLISKGANFAAMRADLLREEARSLPISLLMDESPAEHVFQFVLVNQKATPVSKALLGTIISTSLVASELETIQDRLENADINLEGSRTISILSRDASSPFSGLVARGFEKDSSTKLPWTVLGSIAEIFQDLAGARFYHAATPDHAKVWARHNLEKSGIVEEWQAREYPTEFAYWTHINGPWIEVFKAFWIRTRDRLADTKSSFAPNYWGSPRESNIFNKPSLHILTCDFFSYLREQKVGIDSAEQVGELVDGWLEYASDQYFARDWKLDGVKKDSVGTRRQWSKLWCDHRQVGDLPPIAEFSKLYKV